MQKIGEHLDSGDDTSICAALVTGALQFLPCGGVRSAGHLPSCLAEARSHGDWALEMKAWPRLSAQVPVPQPRPWPGLSGPHHSSPSFTPVPGTVPRLMPLTPISPSNPQLEINAAPSSQQQSSLEWHQNPHQQLASLCSSSSCCCSQHHGVQLSQISEMSLLCIAVCPAVIPGCDRWE